MYKYLRNDQKNVVELTEDRAFYVDVHNPVKRYPVSLTSLPEAPIPEGFLAHPDDPIEVVNRYVVNVSNPNHNASVEPDVFAAVIYVTDSEHDLGLHYDLAVEAAQENGIHGDLLCSDGQGLCIVETSADVSAPNRASGDGGVEQSRQLSAEQENSANVAIRTPALVSNRNLDIILGALRWFQSCKNGEHDMSEICDIVDPDTVSPSYIDQLCENLNGADGSSKFESYGTLVLSTAHMMHEDSVNLAIPAANGCFYWVQDTGVGFRIKLNAVLTVHELESYGIELSNPLKNAFSFAMANGYSAIDFDRDADVVDELPSFAW